MSGQAVPYEETPGYLLRDECADRAADLIRRQGRTQTVLTGNLVDVLSYADRLSETGATAGAAGDKRGERIHGSEYEVILALIEARNAERNARLARSLVWATALLVVATVALVIVSLAVTIAD